MKYLLKHRDDSVCELNIDDTGSITETGMVYHHELLPPGGNQSVQELKKWWQRRAVPMTQEGIGNYLLGIDKTNQEYLTENLGLSMTDHYWICPVQETYRWEDLNFFQNVFEELREEEHKRGSRSPVPGASVSGNLKKYWFVDTDGKRCLMKGNEGQSSQQSLNEIFASKINALQGKQPFTEYRLVPHPEGEERGYCCVSPAFTDERTEFISAYEVVSSEKKPNDRSYYEHFIAVCAQNGLPEEKTRSFLEYQILTDFLITNTDRHFQNFGVLRDTESLQFVSMAPIFDSGNSMFWNYHFIPEKEEAFYSIRTDSFRGTELELLSYIHNFDQPVDLSKMPSEEFLYLLYSKDHMPEERIHGLIQAFRKKERMLSRFLDEKKLLQPGKKYYRKPRLSY